MNEDAPTPRPPTAEQCRAIVLSLLVVVSVVAATAVVPVPVAATSDDATVTLGSTDPGVMTTHNWSITADGASGESLEEVQLDYFGTGANLSAVGAEDLEVTINDNPVDVGFVPDYDDDELLSIVLGTPATVNSGDVVAVNFLNDSVENPTEESTHLGMVYLYTSEFTEITSGSDSFVISSGGIGTIDGQVTSAADGTPIESADVQVADGDGVVGTATTDANGNYSIDVPAGTYDVSVYHQAYETNTTSGVIVGDGETVTADVALTGGGTEPDPASVTLGSTDPGAMTTHNWSITADGASGEQLNRIQLYYTDSGTNFSATGVDDIEIAVDGATIGADSLEDIGDENLSVVLTTPVAVNGGDEVTVNFLADVVENPTIKSSYYASIGLLGSQEVGEISSGFDEFAIGAGTIDGRVTNSSDGTGIDGAQVQVIPDEGWGTSAVTNATGYYDVSVAEGTYDVSVTHEEYDTNTTSGVSVVGGETTTVDVSLSSAAFSVVEGSIDVEYVSGTKPDQLPTVRSYESNLAGISLLNESHGQDLASLNVASDTELRVNATIQGMMPRQLIGTIHDASWEVTDVDGDRVNVTIVGKPASAQYMLDAPSLDNWPDDGTDQADMKYEQMWDVALDDMEYGGLSPTELDQVNGSILATDAQAFSMPSYDEGPEGEAGTLSIEIGGPHLTVDGTTNHGYFEGFIPGAQLDAWNVTNPGTELVANYAGNGVDGMTVTSVDGGAKFEFPVHYSAGEVSMTASTPANFDVAIEDTNAPVIEGGDLTVDVNVTNAGGVSAAQAVNLTDFGGTEVDSQSVELAGGENETITLTWKTSEGDNATDSITVASEDDTATQTVTVNDGGFDVTIEETNAPVVEGTTLDVNVTVENTGDGTATQDIHLAGFDGTVVDSNTSVQLPAGESTNFNLSWTTASADVGQDDIAVSSDDDTATATVTVQQRANFDVTIEETNAPVVEGDTLDVNVTIQNTGDVTGTQTITLLNSSGNPLDSAEKSVGGGETANFNLAWTTGDGDAGDEQLTVVSENDSATRTVTVAEPASFDVTIDTANAPVTEGEELTVNVTVQNTGDVSATQDVNLTGFDDTVVDTRSIQLAGGASQTVTLTWTTANGDNGTDTVSVTSDDDAAARTVTVNELVFDVTIDGTNAPVTEGDVLTVDVSVENKRDATVTQTINLSDFGGTVVDRNESVTLDGSESASFTLRWNTDDGDAGSGSLTVTSDNGSASRAVTIETDSSGGSPLPPRNPDLAIVELDASATTVAIGETVSVDVLVENTGTADGEYDLELTAGGTVVDAASVPVAADGTATVTLSHAFDEPGSYDLAVNGASVGTVDVEATDGDPNDDGDDEAGDEGGEGGDSEADEPGDDEDGTDGSDDDSTPGFTPIAAILGLLYVVLRRTSSTNRR